MLSKGFNMKQMSLISEVKEQSLRENAEKQILENRNDFAWGLREWSIETILEKFGANGDPNSNCELFIPEYQRDYKWEDKIASRFIESILLGFPIPYLYIATVEDFNDQSQDGRVEIIDGSQRIRALRYFVDNEFPLSKLKELTSLEGFYYRDLLPGRQRKFMRESLRFIELKCDSDGEYRRNLFERINSGFKRLIPMEVRKGSEEALSSFYTNVIKPCSELALFRQLAPLSQSRRSNEDYAELVLRFFAYSDNIDNYKGSVKDFLDEYFNQKAKESIDENSYLNKFKQTLEFVNNHFPFGFRKTANAQTISKTYFEAIAVGSFLALKESDEKNLKTDSILTWLTSPTFIAIVTSDGANNTKKLKNRINFVKNKLLDVEESWMSENDD